MNDMTPAGIGHNAPPSPLGDIAAKYDDHLSEVANWTDGEPVTTEAQHDAVASLIKTQKTYRSELVKAGKEVTEILHRAWKAAVAAVKVYTDRADMEQAALVACVAPFKAQLVEAKRQAERAAWEAADKLRREAEAKAKAANAADLDAQMEAHAAQQAAMDAQKAASAASKDKVGGLRTVHHHEIDSLRDVLNDVIAEDRDAMTAFLTAYVQSNFRKRAIKGVRTWETKEAF